MSKCSLSDGEGLPAASGLSQNGSLDKDNQNPDAPGIWNTMPEVVLVHIASFLRRWDRVSMARVCRKWYGAVMDAPSLWRFTEVHIRGNWRDNFELDYIRSRGRFLRNLNISGNIRCQRHVKKFQRTFTTIFATLYRHGPVQLHKLTVSDMELQHYFRGTSGGFARRGVLRSLRRFLRKQQNLRHLNISFNAVTKEEGLNLLESTSQSCRAKIVETLNLVDFFQNGEEIHRETEFVDVMSQFLYLTTLRLNYSCLSDELLLRLSANAPQTKLETLDVRCPRVDVTYHSIHHGAWRTFSSAFPTVRVKFQINGLLKISDIQRIMIPDIPLHSLLLHGHNDDSFHPDRTLRHLARNYKSIVEKIVVDVSPCYRFYNQGLVSLVKDCTKLQSLELRGRVQWPTLREIFELQDEKYYRYNKAPPLQYFHMIVSSYRVDSYEEEAIVYEEYRSSFVRYNLDYEILVEPQFYPLPIEYNEHDEVVQVFGPPIVIDD